MADARLQNALNTRINKIMTNFRQWLETSQNVIYVSKNNYGDITFIVNGKRETYHVDALLFQNKQFLSDLRKNPEEALREVKKRATA